MPTETNVELSFIIVPFDIMMLVESANGIGVSWKQASVSSDFKGHSLKSKREGKGTVSAQPSSFFHARVRSKRHYTRIYTLPMLVATAMVRADALHCLHSGSGFPHDASRDSIIYPGFY